MLRRQRESLVEGVRVQALRTAGDRGQRLHRDAHDVVLGLLRGQRRASGLRVEAEGERARIGGSELVAHDPRPEATCGTELCNLLEEVVVRVEDRKSVV